MTKSWGVKLFGWLISDFPEVSTVTCPVKNIFSQYDKIMEKYLPRNSLVYWNKSKLKEIRPMAFQVSETGWNLFSFFEWFHQKNRAIPLFLDDYKSVIETAALKSSHREVFLKQNRANIALYLLIPKIFLQQTLHLKSWRAWDHGEKSDRKSML